MGPVPETRTGRLTKFENSVPVKKIAVYHRQNLSELTEILFLYIKHS